jgi:CspA family cold shock protein
LSLTHHGRGRTTRRRGFDDDFTYDRAPSGDGPRYQTPSSPPKAGFSPELDATVKWFNSDKGFGFVALSDGSGDVFLHASALTIAGHSSVSPGASLRVRVGQGQKGRQITEVLAVDEGTGTQTPIRRAQAPYSPSDPGRGPALEAAVERRGTVKWYNATKGFGFVAIADSADSGKDVFVPAFALQRSGVPQLIEGQTVWVGVMQGAKFPPSDNSPGRFHS